MKESGYEIEAVPNKGYHLVGQEDVLNENEIASRLKTKWVGRQKAYAPRVAAITALMVCIRFSASSKTTDWEDSKTSSVTSISVMPNFSPICMQYFPSKELVKTCEQIAKENGGAITLTEDAMAGTRDADVIYTDVWVSMGEPDEVWEERIKELSPYQVNGRIMANAKDTAIFMHCLPAFHDLNFRTGYHPGIAHIITGVSHIRHLFPF